MSKIIIATNSNSMLSKIQSGFLWYDWVRYIQLSKLINIIWIYSPAHSSIKGNERADSLASTAQTLGRFTYTRTEVIQKLYDNIIRTTTKDRLLD